MKPTLLIVDDVQRIREEARLALEGEFDIVGEAKDGIEAIDLFRRTLPTLILMDVVMPNMSGIEATRILMQGPAPHPKIVLFSALKEESVVKEGMKAGACIYLFKPVPGEKLIEVLKRFAKT